MRGIDRFSCEIPYRYREGTSKIAYRPVKYFIEYVIAVLVIFAALFGSSLLVATPGSAQLIFDPPSKVLVVGSDQQLPVTWDLPTVNPGTPSFLYWVRWRRGDSGLIELAQFTGGDPRTHSITEHNDNPLQNGADERRRRTGNRLHRAMEIWESVVFDVAATANRCEHDIG